MLVIYTRNYAKDDTNTHIKKRTGITIFFGSPEEGMINSADRKVREDFFFWRLRDEEFFLFF